MPDTAAKPRRQRSTSRRDEFTVTAPPGVGVGDPDGSFDDGPVNLTAAIAFLVLRAGAPGAPDETIDSFATDEQARADCQERQRNDPGHSYRVREANPVD